MHSSLLFTSFVSLLILLLLYQGLMQFHLTAPHSALAYLALFDLNIDTEISISFASSTCLTIFNFRKARMRLPHRMFSTNGRLLSEYEQASDKDCLFNGSTKSEFSSTSGMSTNPLSVILGCGIMRSFVFIFSSLYNKMSRSKVLGPQ